MRVLTMDEAELFLWRVERLQAAIDRLTDGNKTAFARLLGYSDGAFIRQMLSGKRPIGEKLIRTIEAHQGMDGWFSPNGYRVGPLEAQIRAELATREVPDHVLTSILELIRGFPERHRKSA